SCLILLGVGAAALFWQTREDAPTVAANYSRQETPPQVATPPLAGDPGAMESTEPLGLQPERAPATENTQARRRKAEKRNQRTQTAPRIVEISLKEEDLQRGDGGGRQRIISLSPERQRLRLRMPRGSAGGRYTVRIVDAFGKTLATKAANSDGKTLTVDLDLRTLAARKCRLCLARDGEAPDCYMVSVNGQ
ncbi:MAG: hypothetical protein LC802_24355, partial [Acidobacteria bacterium]|nr:hypothetical protein [Acidobacteriota bacterium]